MRKIFVCALLAVAATSAFAGDSDALKAIMKAKTYAEAEQLVKTTVEQLTSNEEKAKAYNKLVDLAMDKYNKESATMTENQVAKQMGGKEKPVDEIAMADAVVDAIMAATECEKYDQMPNAKGKVAPKFHEKNKTRLWNARVCLVNVGQNVAQQGNDAGVLKYWGAFTESDVAPLFEGCDKSAEKDYVGQVALFAARYAYQAKELDRAIKYCDVAMQSETEAKDALDLKFYILKSNLKSEADSLRFLDNLKAEYAKNPSNDNLMDNLYNMYMAMKQKDEAVKLIDNRLAQDPNNFVALADKGMLAIQDNDVETAVKFLKQAVAVDSKNAVVLTYLGACYNTQAANAENANSRKAYYKEAVEILDKAKEVDPGKAISNWGYVRYQAYYGYYGAEASETKAAEAESH